MQNTLLDIEGELSYHILKSTALSFAKFIEHLRCRVKTDQTVRAKFYRFVLRKFEMHPELSHAVQLHEIRKYEELLELTAASLLPFTYDENNHLWGLSAPLLPRIFYGTDALYKLLRDKNSGKALPEAVAPIDDDKLRKKRTEMVYSFVLERLYNIPSAVKYELVHSFFDKEANIQKYYKLMIDPTFIDVHVNCTLPELNFDALQLHFNDNNVIDYLKEFLPLSMFRFEGFSVIKLVNVTEEHAIEIIKDSILNRTAHNDDFYYDRVVQSLKTLSGNNAIEFGLMPMLRINKKLIFNPETCLRSILIEKARKLGVAEPAYLTMAEKYSEKAKLLFYKTITPEDEQRQMFLKILKQHGIHSYAMIPVLYGDQLAGIVEVYCAKENLLDEKILAKLETVLPLLSQLMQNSIDEFDSRIDDIIKEKFTSLQPAVYWKFNETAWHYYKERHLKREKAEIGTVYFENVFPLYGAIDIRNSTVERNNALRADLKTQFNVLIETLTALKQQFHLGLIDEKIFECREWMNSVSEYLSANDEINLTTFLTQDINSFLFHFKQNHSSAANLVDKYFNAIDASTGVVHENRRLLETSMQIINKAINERLDQFNAELQKSYPCYFEKIRTDGVEYDIYIGQSIAPAMPFDMLYLSNLRLWQLTSMADIAKLSDSLLPQLPKALNTTQLIFVHANPIDISFRNDERRFDVEGTYNIRYQVIKKRIDKVHVLNTNERLTQPGKIALIYFNKTDADEYIKYIYYLQEQNILNDDLEQLELEELQGVSGLKALRVGVNLD
jgi:hypothetical protein